MSNQRDVESVGGSMLENGSNEVLVKELHKYYKILIIVKVKNIIINRQLFPDICLVFRKQVSPNLE